MTSADAMAIVRERAGTTYDPRVVAKFVEIHFDEEREPETAQLSPGLSAIAEAIPSDAARHWSNGLPGLDIRVAAALYDLGGAIAWDGSALAERLHGVLAQIMPATCTAVFVYDAATDELVARQAAGRHAPEIRGLAIPLGQRLSGWVAAQRSTIVNSDAALDLGRLALRVDPPLRSCLSTALCVGDQLVGAVTIYSTDLTPFDGAHVDLLEVLAPRIADAQRDPQVCTRIVDDVGHPSPQTTRPDTRRLMAR